MSMQSNFDALYTNIVEPSNSASPNGNTIDVILNRLTAIETQLAQMSSTMEKTENAVNTSEPTNSERSESENESEDENNA